MITSTAIKFAVALSSPLFLLVLTRLEPALPGLASSPHHRWSDSNARRKFPPTQPVKTLVFATPQESTNEGEPGAMKALRNVIA